LAEANNRVGDRAQAEWLLRLLVAEGSKDLGVRVALFDLVLVKEDLQAIRKAVTSLQEVEGSEGVFWRYGRSCELIVQAKKGNKAGLDEARKLLTFVATEAKQKIAPERVDLALAQCYEAVGDTEKARTLYKKALARKPKDVVAVLRAYATFLVRI